MGVKSFVKRILTEKENRRYERQLEGKKVSYEGWLTAAEKERKNPEETMGAADGNRAVDSARENSDKDDTIVILAGKGTLSTERLSYAIKWLREDPEILLVYGDEDVWGEVVPVHGAEAGGKAAVKGNGGKAAAGGKAAKTGERQSPWFKPDWSPDLLDSFFYFGSAVILRGDFFRRTPRSGDFLEELKREEAVPAQDDPAWGEDRKEADLCGAAVFYRVTDLQNYERWVQQCVRLAGGYEKGARCIGHVPGILFHCGSREEQEKFLGSSFPAAESRRELVGEFRRRNALPEGRGSDRAGEIVESFREPAKTDGIGKACVSIVIPSRDQPKILEKCLEGCVLAAGLPEGGTLPFEVIVVDNGSRPENRRQIEGLLEEMNSRCCRAVYLYHPEEFHFSRMCNMGAEEAEGAFLLFLNDDVELCCPGCLEKMAALASREMTGAVGLKLYYPDSVRIQHAGITNLPMGPVHKLQFLEDNTGYYYGANRGLRNVLAVTAACLMAERKKYIEAGGFAEELRVAFNDVDLCFRLYELGYRNVCDNEEYAYHHESLSRGADETTEKLERLLQERDRLYKRHPALEGQDPYYSPFLNREGLDTAIRPAYLTAGNGRQEISEGAALYRDFSLRGYRQDACLLVRIEDCRKGRILGYGVVLGDNNACYERMLLLGKVQEAESVEAEGIVAKSMTAENAMAKSIVSKSAATEYTAGESGPERSSAGISVVGEGIYAVKLAGQYRPDLEENMPDQVRVGLCGFDVEFHGEMLPRGKYRLGMAVRNRVTGMKLVNWSNRCTMFSENL